MPELPEVQTIVSDLNAKIAGDTITGFWSDWKKALKNISVEAFAKQVKGRSIRGVRRMGKNIFIDLSGGKTIYIHLKMTGHLLVKYQTPRSKSQVNSKFFNDRVNQYIHHIWKLKAKNQKLKAEVDKTLEFSDLRKFGKIVLVDTDKIGDLKEIKELGIDAMDKRFTLDRFEEIVRQKKKKKIRDILMEQNIISGIGNIYASEILFAARVLPERRVETLNTKERKAIYQSIKTILNKAIMLRGTSDSDYRDTSGAPGEFQKMLMVYRRTGKKCPKCDTIITRVKMGQRSAFYCPQCQK